MFCFHYGKLLFMAEEKYLPFHPSGRDAGGERPRLKLAPRTKPIEKAATTQPQSQSSIFGGAKPVDTAAREREIEDRLKRQRDIETEKIEQEKESRESRYR